MQLQGRTSTEAAAAVGHTVECCWVGLPGDELPASTALALRAGEQARYTAVRAGDLAAYLDGLTRPLGAALFSTADGEVIPAAVSELRARQRRTRVYLVAPDDRILPPDGGGELDVEEVVSRGSLAGAGLVHLLDRGVRGFRALGDNPLVPRFYLDATFNKLFDWFETTRWEWADVGDFSKVDRSLLREDEIEVLKESAIIEFGTLPGAHNFLREWEDEYSFSSWALSWGAEEARHSLLQCRYLQHLGVEIPAKHAMYKRAPYPMGNNRAATLMMNIISEARAAAYYKRLAAESREPVLQRIWQLLGRDEARHARAFYVFCKEMCERNEKNTVAALEMAYVWLADREGGIKHPAGHFYPHSTSARGIRQTESLYQGMTDDADESVLSMIRKIVGDPSVRTVRDLKAQLRARA